MHNLHGPDRLFETRYGHVLKCACCGRIQVTFREHTLLVDEGELETLTDTINRARQKVRDAEESGPWRLQTSTDAGPVSITLTEPSLRTLHALLRGAWSMYTLRKRVGAVAPGEQGEARDVLRDHAPSPRSRWSGVDRSP